MSQFADGGLMSTKPYISSSNYIMKMSDYSKGKVFGMVFIGVSFLKIKLFLRQIQDYQ